MSQTVNAEVTAATDRSPAFLTSTGLTGAQRSASQSQWYDLAERRQSGDDRRGIASVTRNCLGSGRSVKDMGTDLKPAIDGRHARRARSRIAVIDAVFALVRNGKIPLTVEDLAEHAGVSVSSVFRNFDGLDDMQRQAFDVFRERYSKLFDPVALSTSSRRQRVTQHVKSRLELLEAAGPILQIARHRALDYQPISEGVARSRSQLSDQTRSHFATEVAQLTPAEASNLIAVIDALTSPEAYDVLRAAHGRSDRQIAQSWTRSIEAILAGWPGVQPDVDTGKENMA